LPVEFGQSDGQFTPDAHALILVNSQATSQVLRRVRADPQGVFQLDLPHSDYFVQSAHLRRSFGVQVIVLEGTGHYRIVVDTAERN
jgi:predicted nucleic acid-binding Zn ribbon protein